MNVLGVWKCDLLNLYFTEINGHHVEGDLLIEPALPTASRIQPEDAINHLYFVDNFRKNQVSKNIINLFADLP